jgi:Bacterial lectin
MKVGISRFVIVASVAVLVFAGSVAPVLAQSPSFSDFSSTTNLTLNGNAAAPVNNGTANVLRLTPATMSQAGSAWFNIQQPVSGGFTTKFQFQFTGASDPPADGIAFVIQNSSLSALGQAGGSIGYADGGLPCGENPPPCGGIPNSLAVEFDTFNNTTATGDPNANHIAVQSCGVVEGVPQRNSPAHVSPNDFNFPDCHIGTIASTLSTTMSDGAVHTVVIDYTPAHSCGGDSCPATLTVNLDTIDVLTTVVTLENEINLSSGKAWVGLTGATGAAFENHDILSWTFTPHTSTTIEENIPPGQQGVFTFGSFNYKVTNSNNTALDLIVTANSLSPDTVFPSPGGQCIVYAGTGGNCWGFDVHCPVTGCTASTANLDLATSYDSDQPAAFFTSPGFLKIEPDCASIDTGTATDQITDFLFLRHDPTTKGNSGGGISCWVATINTPTPYAASIQQPINSDGSSIFSGKKGVVPVKFTLIMNGAPTCSLPPATIAVTRTAGGVLQAIDESVYTMAADSGSNFRVSGCQYVYNLSAAAMGPGTYRVDIFIAGSKVGSATFALK